MNLEDKAFGFAIEKHKGQKYGDKEYSYHLAAVVAKVDTLYNGVDDATACVAWLHDCIEDTDTTFFDIKERFGVNIAYSVLYLSKEKNQSYEDYIRTVKRDEVSLKVKIADTLCNLEESIKVNDEWRINKYIKQLELLTKN